MKFLVVVVGAGALAVLGALICVIASVYPRKRLSLGDNSTVVTEGPGGTAGPEAVAQAGPLGALHGGHALGGLDLDLDLSLNELGGAPLNPLSFSRLLCTPLPPGDCRGEGGLGGEQGRIQADDPRGDREEWRGLRATADELQQVIVQQNQQILMDQRTIRELTGKLSECESGLEEGAGPAGAGSVGLWAGDEMGSTQRAVEELARAIMELKDRIEKLEAEIGPAALNRSEFLSAPKPRPPPPPAPGPAHRPAHPHRPSGKAPPTRTKAPKAPWRVEDLEGELERKIKLLEKEREAMKKEGAGEAGPGDFTDRRPGTGDRPGTADRAEQGGAEPEQNPGGEGERQHPLVEPSFPDGFVLSFPMRTNYMYGVVRREVTEMYAFTACLWLRPLESGIGTPFSYSVPGQPNELVLLQGAHNPVELLINDKVAQLPLELTRNRWQHICVSWTLRDGVWKAYQGGKLRGRGEGLAAWHPIKPGGVLILGQEQDTVGGRFDASQALVGELSQFNLWDRVLRPAEVQALSECSSPALGNIAPWTDHDVDVYGGATKESGEPCAADRKTTSPNL